MSVPEYPKEAITAKLHGRIIYDAKINITSEAGTSATRLFLPDQIEPLELCCWSFRSFS